MHTYIHTGAAGGGHRQLGSECHARGAEQDQRLLPERCSATGARIITRIIMIINPAYDHFQLYVINNIPLPPIIIISKPPQLMDDDPTLLLVLPACLVR